MAVSNTTPLVRSSPQETNRDNVTVRFRSNLHDPPEVISTPARATPGGALTASPAAASMLVARSHERLMHWPPIGQPVPELETADAVQLGPFSETVAFAPELDHPVGGGIAILLDR